MTLVFMFPGQSSRYPEMLDKLLALNAGNKTILEQASDTLGRDLAAWYRSENDAAFELNRDVQVGVFVANHLYRETLRAHGIESELSLGLSLGEYNHLVDIGAIEFVDALRVVERRGELYDDGPDGMMASVFPLELDALMPIVERAREFGLLEVGNMNSPRQHVLSGERAAVERALAILEDEQFIEGVVIEQKIPMHSSRFAPVGDALRPVLASARWQSPSKPYVPNVSGSIVRDPTHDGIVESLTQHVSSPVLWRRSLEQIVATHPRARFVEVGPRGVLYNLMDKKWLKNPRFKTDAPENHTTLFAGVVSELSNAA